MTTRVMKSRAARRRKGFTLAEILLAMGILAIGMVMVAAAFPTAITQSKETHHNTLATIIGENAVAISQAELRSSTIKARISGAAVAITGALEEVDDASSWHKLNRVHLLPQLPSPLTQPWVDAQWSAHQYGWALLGMKSASNNDYTFVVVPYAKFPTLTYADPSDSAHDDAPWLKEQQVSIDPAANTMTLQGSFDDKCLALGSPVILKKNGAFAYITGFDGPPGNRAAVLSGNFGLSAVANETVWIMPAADTEGPSPAIGCFMFRTALRP